MDLNKLTIRSQAALEGARQQAVARNHQAIEPEHLLVALLSDPEGIVFPLLHGLGVAPRSLRDRAAAALDRIPKVYAQGARSGRPGPRDGPRCGVPRGRGARRRVRLDRAPPFSRCSEGATEAARILREAGVERDGVLQALAQVRGRQRVTDQNPEDKVQALERYGRDLTDLARRGKLDPVIGRDDEIRRVIQVLSRRTKNNPVLIGEPGVGKTAIVEGLAQRIVSGRRAGVPQGQARGRAGPGRDGRRVQVPRRVRGPAQGGPAGDRRLRGPDRHVHRRAPHDRRCRRGRGSHGRREHAEADARAW